MTSSSTLFLIAKRGVKKGAEPGLLESWMWNLSDQDRAMEYVSLHKSKSDRAHKGGKIVGFRKASEQEIVAHQTILADLGEDPMQDTVDREIVVFETNPKWNKLWPKDARSHQMAYKANGFITASK